jgi:predicted oxidoreductase
MMRFVGCDDPASFVRAALEAGLNFFDHADIYGGGESERTFGKAVAGLPRESYILQSKCGICTGYYDLSKGHILKSADNSLYRLNAEYLDVFLLHRPDALMEPEEIAEAFDELYQKGKVRHFGVSNMNPMQIQMLRKFIKQPLIVNQMQLSLVESRLIDSGLHVNTASENAVMRAGSVLEFCRVEDIIIQVWSPLQYGAIHGVYLDNPDYPALNAEIGRLAEQYGVSNTAIALAWILRHPATPQVITGTVNAKRIPALLEAMTVELTRPEWYGLYRTAGKFLP